MHSTTTTAPFGLPETPSTTTPESLLELINNVLSLLLVSSLTVRSFIGRWQVVFSKLSSLQSSVSEISVSPYWSINPLLQALLPSLLSNLQRLKCLCDKCSDSTFSGGKLLMQSDLDMASASLFNQIQDLDLLLRSGVLQQSNAIVLSQPTAGSNKEDIAFFIKDLFTRLQIGGIEFKKKALESMLQLLSGDEKSESLVAKEGNFRYLIHLLDFNNQPSIQEQALSVVSILASANEESTRSMFEEGGLGPLLRILETGSAPMKEKAASVVEAITSDSINAWAISAYGGVPILIEACRSGTPATQAHTAGAIGNIAAIEDIKTALAEEGAIPVLIQLLVSSSTIAQGKAANCIAILASSGEYFRALIIQERGLQRLLLLMQDSSNLDTLEQVLRAMNALSASDSIARFLSSSTIFIVRLGEFVKHSNLSLQQISVSLLANLPISDGNKRAIGSCMGSLVKLIEMPKPVGLQEAAVQALKALLTVRSNRKELVRDEKSVMRLVQMLNPKNEVVEKNFPIIIITALLAGGSHGCRKRLLAAGAYENLQSLTGIEVPGAKKALHRLTGSKLRNIFSRSWRELAA